MRLGNLAAIHNNAINLPFSINCTNISCTNFKYLGLMFNSGRSLQFDSSYVTRKYYGSCNSILGHCKYADECVRLSDLVLLSHFVFLCLFYILYWCCRCLWSTGKGPSCMFLLDVFLVIKDMNL